MLANLLTRLASNPVLVADEGPHAFEAAHEAVLRFLMPGRVADLGVGVQEGQGEVLGFIGGRRGLLDGVGRGSG